MQLKTNNKVKNPQILEKPYARYFIPKLAGSYQIFPFLPVSNIININMHLVVK